MCTSVCPSVRNGNKNAYSSIINSEIVIRISGENAWHLLQEMKRYLKKYIFGNFLTEVSKNCFIAYYSFLTDGRVIFG